MQKYNGLSTSQLDKKEKISIKLKNANLNENLKSMVKSTVETHEKMNKKLTKNVILPFTPAEMTLNLWSAELSQDELEVLKYGLKNSIETS